MEALEPLRVNEIGDQSAVNLVAELVRLTGVANLVGIEARADRSLIKNGKVDVRIDQHFQKLVAASDRPRLLVSDVGAGENLAHRQPGIGDIVIAKRARLIRIIEDREPPFIRRRLASLRYEPQLRRYAPGRPGVIVDLFLQRRNDGGNLVVRQHGAVVDHCDFYGHGKLPSRWLMTDDFRRGSITRAGQTMRLGSRCGLLSIKSGW